MSKVALPSPALAAAQSAWLQPARWRLLRRAQIARRRSILDLGCGWGHVSQELRRRSSGSVIALDISAAGLAALAGEPGVWPVQADAHRLPLGDGVLDLVFAQCAFLWFADPGQVVHEVHRVLGPTGVGALVEPDFGGLMEYPQESAVRDLWIDALSRAGADPCIGRRLPALLSAAGFAVEVGFLEQLEAPRGERYDLLAELALAPHERARIATARAAAETAGCHCVAHLPFWLIIAQKR